MISIKNRLFPSFLILILAVLCVTGCAGKHGKLMKSAQANYQVNNYEAALRDAVAALNQKPNYVEAQNFAPIFFNAAMAAAQERIEALKATSDKFKWDEIVAEYKGLIEINALVQNLPPLTHKKTKQPITFEIQDYTHQLNEASEEAAEVHYQEGIRIANSSDDVETQKRAAQEFKTVEEFVPGYKDALSRYEQSRSAGTKQMAILTFHNERLLGTVTDNITIAVLEDAVAREFLSIVPRVELAHVIADQDLSGAEQMDEQTVTAIGKALSVHEMVVVQITELIYTPPNTKVTKSDRQKTKRKKTGTKRSVDEDGNVKTEPKYTTVKITAKFSHHQRESSVSIIGFYEILDAQTAELKKTEDFTTKHEFKTEWGSFTGDEDALKASDKRLLGKEQQAPAEAVMVSEALNELSNELAEALKAYVH